MKAENVKLTLSEFLQSLANAPANEKNTVRFLLDLWERAFAATGLSPNTAKAKDMIKSARSIFEGGKGAADLDWSGHAINHVPIGTMKDVALTYYDGSRLINHSSETAIKAAASLLDAIQVAMDLPDDFPGDKLSRLVSAARNYSLNSWTLQRARRMTHG